MRVTFRTHSKATYKDRIQFQPAGAPVPLTINPITVNYDSFPEDDLQLIVKTSLADRKPYVFETPMGSHMRHRKKSSIKIKIEKRKTAEYNLGGR